MTLLQDRVVDLEADAVVRLERIQRLERVVVLLWRARCMGSGVTETRSLIRAIETDADIGRDEAAP